jgi:thioredoxin 1
MASAGNKSVRILFFYTDWCGPALRLKELLRFLTPVGKYPLEIRYVNTNRNPFLKRKYRVKLIPTAVFIKNGREFKKIPGAWHLKKYQEVLDRDQSR